MFTKNNTFQSLFATKYIFFYLVVAIFLLGNIYHIGALSLNEVLRESDSIAYLQMSYYLKQLSQEGLGSGWFGFLYSLPITLIDILIQDDFLSAQILNIILLNISGIIFYSLGKKFLKPGYILFTLLVFFISPTLLHFNIHILSENIYIPIFLALFLTTWNFVEKIQEKGAHYISQILLISSLLGLLYLTRAESFIYMLSIGMISLILCIKKQLSLGQFFMYGAIFCVGFFVFIGPYLVHLHDLTGKRSLTNKGASNYRQAELRGTQKMDDAGFEQAVAELTPDKHHLIAGFAGGMRYDTPQIKGSLKENISKNKKEVLQRILTNQKKIFTKNLPEIFLGKSPSLFGSADSRFFGNKIFLIFFSIPFLLLSLGLWEIYIKQRGFLTVFLCFFFPALLFFTLFFTLNRYFLIFLPLLFLIFSYGLQETKYIPKIGKILFGIHFLIVLGLSNIVYYNSEKEKDEYYALKKEVGLWLSTNGYTDEKSNIMERFPIVTYYSGSKNRWITPYTNNVPDIIEYARYNDIEYLIVDTMDFLTYRLELAGVLEETPENMKLIKEWKNEKEQKVRVYKIKDEL